MNEIHCEVMSLASSASPGRVPSGFCVGSGFEKTEATSAKWAVCARAEEEGTQMCQAMSPEEKYPLGN